MSRCLECDKVLTLDDALGHDCEVAPEDGIRDARLKDRDALQSVINFIVSGNG